MNVMLLRHADQTRDMVPHLQTLANLAAEAPTVVEYGVRSAVSTWALLEGLRPDGSLWSVDIDPDIAVPPLVSSDPRWRLVIGDSGEPLDNLPAHCDLLFIDTDHEYHHTLLELAGGDRMDAWRIALHDWNLPDVEDAVAGFVRRSRYRIERIEPSTWGLVVLAR